MSKRKENIRDIFETATACKKDRARNNIPVSSIEEIGYSFLSLQDTMSRINNDFSTIEIDDYGTEAESFSLLSRDGGGVMDGNNLYTKKENKSYRTNALVPNVDTFSKIAQIVRPKDEPFVSNKIFSTDTSTDPGASKIIADIIRHEGEAQIQARSSRNIIRNEADITVVEQTTGVVTITQKIRIPRSEVLAYNLRNTRNYNSPLNLASEKIKTAMRNVFRSAERIFWYGSAEGNVKGYIDYFTTDTTKQNYLGKLVQSGLNPITTSTFEQVIANFRPAANYIVSKGRHSAKVLVLSPKSAVDLAFSLATIGTGTDKAVIAKSASVFLKETLSQIMGHDLDIVTSNVFAKTSTENPTAFTSEAFTMLDNAPDNWTRLLVEPVQVLPAFINEEQDISQVITMSIGGIMGLHPTSAFIGEGL